MKTRILFVDDEPALRHMFAALLSCLRGDWEVAVADSGRQALDLLAQHPFDVVISDMRMPGMNGAQLMNEVRKNHPRTLRIICSGYAEQDLVRQCAGIIHQWLSKPFSTDTLCKAIEGAVDYAPKLQQPRLAALH